MSKYESPFEVITADGTRFRCNEDGYFWEYGVSSEASDIEDRSVVEVGKMIDDEVEWVADFNNVIAVGSVDNDTFLQMPKERRQTICPRCNYLEST